MVNQHSLFEIKGGVGINITSSGASNAHVIDPIDQIARQKQPS